MRKTPIKIDSFNKLLTSLSKSEKRYLKLHIEQNHKGNELYYFYFQAYDEALKSNKGEISLPNGFPMNRLPAIKNYLKEKILSVLAKFHQKSTKRNEILEQLVYVEVCFNKRLYKECASLLRQLEKKALNCWSYNLLLEILQWQLRLLLSNGYDEELKMSLSGFYEKEQKLLYSLNQISFYREIRYELLKINSKNTLTNPIGIDHIERVKSMLSSCEKDNLLPYASIEYNRTMSLYYKLTMDFEKANLHSQYEIALWEDNQKMIWDRIMTSKYINGQINHCEILFCLETFDFCKVELQRLKCDLARLDSKSNNHMRFLTQTIQLELKLNLATYNYLDNGKLISTIKETFFNQVNNQKKAEFLFLFAINAFYKKKWKESLYYVNEIINEYMNSESEDIGCLSQFLRILIHFELDNTEMGESLILRFKFKAREMNLLFNYFRECLKHPLLSKKHHLQLLNEMKGIFVFLKKEEKAYHLWSYFDFLWWVEHKLSKLN